MKFIKKEFVSDFMNETTVTLALLQIEKHENELFFFHSRSDLLMEMARILGMREKIRQYLSGFC